MLAVRKDRPLAFVLVFALGVLVVGAVIATRDSTRLNSVLAFAGLVFAVAMSRGAVAADLENEKWSLLFQRPIRPATHYARILSISSGLILGFLAFASALFALVGAVAGQPIQPVAAAFLGSSIWTITLLCVGVGVSAISASHDLELLLLLIVISAAQGFVTGILELPDALHVALHYILLPIDGIFMTWRWLAGTAGPPGTGDLGHMIVYPLWWLAIAWTVIARVEKPATVDALGARRRGRGGRRERDG